MQTFPSSIALQSPPQEPNSHPGAGFGTRRIREPYSKRPSQLAEHDTPAGSLVTVPEPLIVTVSCCIFSAKIAPTRGLPDPPTVNAQLSGSVPGQAPPFHLTKSHPASGIARKCTVVPFGKLYVQSGRQLIPAGVLSIRPLPVTPAWTKPAGAAHAATATAATAAHAATTIRPLTRSR